MTVVAYVEDDDVIRENISETLQEHGFEVVQLATKEAAKQYFSSQNPNLVLLDIQLGQDRQAGYELCGVIRAKDDYTPVIFLTSYSEEMDKILGLRIGADDYVTKDTSEAYLLARIDALMRRTTKTEAVVAAIAPNAASQLVLDESYCRALWKESGVDLTLTQYWILADLVKNSGKVRTHDQLMSAAQMFVEPNTIVAHIKAIRNAFKEIDAAFESVKTERGKGYRWVE